MCVSRDSEVKPRYWIYAMKDKGFLLFEVLITIVIITAGLLFIIQAYRASKDGLRRSTQILRTSFLLEQKMWEFEEQGEIEEGTETGDFGSAGRYVWNIDAARIEDTNFNTVILSVYQEDDPEKTKYSIQTFLKNKVD